jgi:hypothetical protein
MSNSNKIRQLRNFFRTLTSVTLKRAESNLDVQDARTRYDSLSPKFWDGPLFQMTLGDNSPFSHNIPSSLLASAQGPAV